MSGASGKVPAAIHVSPEAALGGPIAQVRDGDRIVLDAASGRLTVEVDDFGDRPLTQAPPIAQIGMGRELFTGFRQLAGPAEEGGLSIPGLAGVSETALPSVPA
jgi:phosphogluconate dehydratase